jgi:hypothetical protein
VIHGTPPQNETSDPTTPSRWTVADRNGSFDLPPSSATTPASLLSDSECDPNRNCTGGYVQGTLRGDRAQGDIVMTVGDPVPADIGAKLAKLHLEITHREQNGDDIDHQRVIISTGLPDGFQTVCQLSGAGEDVPLRGDWRTDPFECDLAGVQLPYFPTGNLELTYEVQLKGPRSGDNPPARTATIGLDAVRMTAEFARPTAQTSQPSDPVLQVDGGGVLHTDGTLDLPTGAVRIDFGQRSTNVFGRGVIVRTLDASNFPNDAGFRPFSLPNGGNYTDRLATFQAFLGSDASPALTARVRFCDAHPDGTDANVSRPDCSGILGGPAKILAWDPTR